MVAAVNDVSPQLLRENALKAVLVDMDDTLLEFQQTQLKPEFISWMQSLKDADIPALILSNGSRRRVRDCANELGVAGLALTGKPFPAAFRRGLETLGAKASHTAMIGDQLFTDVVGANLAGLTSILVTPLGSGGLPHTRMIRNVEAWLLKASQEGGEHGRSLHR